MIPTAVQTALVLRGRAVLAALHAVVLAMACEPDATFDARACTELVVLQGLSWETEAQPPLVSVGLDPPPPASCGADYVRIAGGQISGHVGAAVQRVWIDDPEVLGGSRVRISVELGSDGAAQIDRQLSRRALHLLGYRDAVVLLEGWEYDPPWGERPVLSSLQLGAKVGELDDSAMGLELSVALGLPEDVSYGPSAGIVKLDLLLLGLGSATAHRLRFVTGEAGPSYLNAEALGKPHAYAGIVGIQQLVWQGLREHAGMGFVLQGGAGDPATGWRQFSLGSADHLPIGRLEVDAVWIDGDGVETTPVAARGTLDIGVPTLLRAPR